MNTKDYKGFNYDIKMVWCTKCNTPLGHIWLKKGEDYNKAICPDCWHKSVTNEGGF
jgi:hypothetical protein